MTIAWQCEIGAFPSCVLAHHWPEVTNYGDITKASGLPAVDIVVGGVPCQGASVAGRREGLSDPRTGLWWHFHRVLHEVRPAFFIFENVPGLLSVNGGRDFGAILWALGELGYVGAWRILDAQFHGVPQRRRRIFIVGCLGDRAGPAEILLEPEGGGWDPAESGEEGPDVARCLTSPPTGARLDGTVETFVIQDANRHRKSQNGLGISRGVCPTLNAQGRHAVANTLTSNRKGGKRYLEDTFIGDQVAATIRSLSSRNSNAPGRRGDDDVNPVAVPRVADPITASEGRTYTHEGRNNFRTHNLLPWELRQITHPENRSRPEVGDPAVTIANTNTPMVGVRRLTPLECERLMGLPDSWTNIPGASDSARYAAIGNAVAVPVIEWIARRIMARA